jgi:adenylate cyclase
MDAQGHLTTHRKLAAILAADVVGYARMMGADEAATVRALHTLRAEVFGPVFADHKGEVVKSMGDGWLIEFSSSVSAVNAAMQVQDRLKGHPTIRLRMGIHIGDLTRNEHDLYGDGINIAARLEALAPVGGILISDAVYSGLDGTLSPSFESAGLQSLKNIARPVMAWVRQGPAPSEHVDRIDLRSSSLPSLSIQPVANSDPRSELRDLSDALTADLGTYFSSINWLNTVISSAETANGYRLRPTLRARADRLRLEVRLYAPDGDVIWTHKSDSTLDDAFDWQDNVVNAIADHSIGMILEAEMMRITAIPDDQMTAEQCVLMGIMEWRDFSLDSYVRSVAFHDRAIKAKPDMADAYAEAIIVTNAARTMSANTDLLPYLDKMADWVEAGRALAPGHALLTLAVALATYTQDRKVVPLRSAVAQTLRLAPFDARVLGYCGWANVWSGQTDEAYGCFVKALEFGRLGPFYVASLGGAGLASVQLGRDAEALDFVNRGLAKSENYSTLFVIKSAALANLGRLDEARAAMAHYRTMEPDRTLKQWEAGNNYGGSEGGKRYFAALRIAGLPEG